VEMISKAERPLLIAGQGVFQRKAWAVLKELAEKSDIAVITSGPTRGHFPDDHRLSASLTPDALMSADLVIFVGQYCAVPESFASTLTSRRFEFIRFRKTWEETGPLILESSATRRSFWKSSQGACLERNATPG
jgi:thiamine pyrophosphate-dependent acetolactate synthase large subunit-like protein